jgi:beta-lactamase class A
VGGLIALAGVLFVAGCGGGAATPSPAPTATATPERDPTRVAGTSFDVPLPTTPSPEPTPEPVVVSFDFLDSGASAPALPSTFAPRTRDTALVGVIQNALAGFEGEFSVVVHNLADGRAAAVNESHIYNAASLFKTALLLEAYRQRDAGEQDFSQLLTLTQEYADYDLGTLQYLGMRIGDFVTLGDAIKSMVILSDTPTAVMVQDTINPRRADDTLRQLGAYDMSVSVYELPTTAYDMSLLIEAIAAGTFVSEESRREMLSLLLQEQYPAGIPAGVPPGTAVAHKTGNVTGASHDVALVWGPGGPYVIAVLSDRSWEAEPLRAVSEAVWNYFAGAR